MHKQFQRRNQIIIVAIFSLLVLCAISYVGVGWYFSNKLLAVQTQKVEYDQTIESVKDNTYTIKGSAYDIDGIIGGYREDGSSIGIFEPAKRIQTESKVSERSLRALDGPALVPGQKVSLQGNMWLSDPKRALGLDFTEVSYDSQVGSLKAWVIPANNSKTWTITVHGIGAQRNEMLRFVQAIHASGSTAMVINYRNDTGNPAAPDKRNHFGDTEWQDVESAVAYAKAHGATQINLYGSSLGGSLIQNYIRRSDNMALPIHKVVLDSPALDWNEILAFRTKKMGYPAFVAKPGKDLARIRAGVNFSRATTQPGSIRYPTLIIHNKDDNSVPQAANKRVATAQPNLVTFVDFGSGGHIRAWNHDPERYNQLVANYLQK